MPGHTVLLVEDTELIRKLYADKLLDEGYEVRTAADGLEGLRVLHHEAVDLVLLDLMMPRMSGLEMLEAMRADPRTENTPVIVLSNLGQDADVQRGLELGAVDYLIKNSAKPADVVDKIRLTLGFTGEMADPPEPIRVMIRDGELDADALVDDPDREGWFEAHIVCVTCGREF